MPQNPQDILANAAYIHFVKPLKVFWLSAVSAVVIMHSEKQN
jgi:hypothetical protein